MTFFQKIWHFFKKDDIFITAFFLKKGCTKFCASPVLLDFFRPAAYNQIRSNQGYLPIRWLSFQKYFIFDEQISGKGYPLLTVGNSLFSTSKSVNTSIVFIGITPFLFSERTTTRLSLSRSDLIRFSIAYHRLFYYLFDIQIPSRNSSTRGDSFFIG